MPKNAKYAAMGILTAVLGLFTLTLYQSYNSQIHWDEQTIVFDVPLYGQSLSSEDIFLQQAYLADLNQQTELQPKWRSNGIGLPGYSLGWFKLNNGDKALLSVTEQQQVIVIPTNQGYSIMVSVEQPQNALEKLHAADSM
ncbi:PH domain-containing protein [Shewanella gaetbuli]|uniref:PH domain-containing protein n=1 Tax=Shewanella gaetbuli TaxID=220752 RepID=A0A9X1ZJI2_9GAMM|nr:PH domain-containing protein [Shewanella gaetbuli]MCL1143489.1 PH domain-containing protein [Shewanella gaetbuli]